MSEIPLSDHRLTRRRLLIQAAYGGVGAAAIAVGACEGESRSGASQGRPGEAGNPLIYHRSAFRPDLWNGHLDRFTAQSGLATQLSTISSSYNTLTEARLMAGADYDVLFGDVPLHAKWYAAGWVQDLEGLPGLDDLKSRMYPDFLEACMAGDGRMIALPYYTSFVAFHYNEKMLADLSFSLPKSWDDVYAHCKALKANGVPTPMAPILTRDWGLASQVWTAMTRSLGGATFFDEALSPVFEDYDAAHEALSWLHRFYTDGFMPADILTMDYNAATNVYASGQAAFQIFNAYQQKRYNDPESSLIAGRSRIGPMPGTAHETLAIVSMHLLGADRPDREASWALLNFLSGRYDGAFYGPRTISTEFGFGFAYPELWNDPELRTAWSAWTDLDNLRQRQTEGRTLGRAVSAPWFAEWQDAMSILVHETVLGRLTPKQALARSTAKARELAEDA